MRLRKYCSTVYFDPERDLKDPYRVLFEDGSLSNFQEHFQGRVQHFEGKWYEAAQELFKLKWGPTRVPIYTVLLAFTFFVPDLRYKYINIAEWLVDTAKVPVDGTFRGMLPNRFLLLDLLFVGPSSNTHTYMAYNRNRIWPIGGVLTSQPQDATFLVPQR